MKRSKLDFTGDGEMMKRLKLCSYLIRFALEVGPFGNNRANEITWRGG